MESQFESYVATLCNEISNKAVELKHYEVVTIFFGGGTPTILPFSQLIKVLNTIKSNFNLSNDTIITIEVNPETVDKSYLKKLRQEGFSRISFGVQSFDDDLLKKIGRLHNAEKAKQVVKYAAEIGFKDISIDLIYSLPSQTLSEFENDLNTVVALPVTHISCYSLTIEEGTSLAQNSLLIKQLPNDDIDRKMYYLAMEKLADAGFGHYEISNWSKAGFECSHNIGYWTGRQYIGFGIGAHSFIGNQRVANTDSLSDYLAGNSKWVVLENIDKQTAMSEFMILGLRLIKGINIEEFKTLFSVSAYTVFGKQLTKLEQDGLIQISGNNIQLTSKGLDISNSVFVNFI